MRKSPFSGVNRFESMMTVTSPAKLNCWNTPGATQAVGVPSGAITRTETSSTDDIHHSISLALRSTVGPKMFPPN